MGAAFADTNVLVYAYDPADPAKQERAISVLERLAWRGSGAISTQVLGEFFTTVTRSIRPVLSRDDAEWNVAAFVREWTVFDVTIPAALDAIRGVREHRLSYWDSLIWATAKLNGIRTVLSEDFTDGLLLEGVRFANPFGPSFELAALR